MGEDHPSELQDWLVDEAADQESLLAEQQESSLRANALKRALADLNPRERRIMVARQLSETPSNLEELAVEFGISRERVRQIEMRAFQKLQAATKQYSLA